MSAYLHRGFFLKVLDENPKTVLPRVFFYPLQGGPLRNKDAPPQQTAWETLNDTCFIRELIEKYFKACARSDKSTPQNS